MITFKKLGRYGNLGNTLFQYCTLLGVGSKLEYDVKIPNNPTYYEHSYENYNYSIFDGFNIPTEILSSTDIIETEYDYRGHVYDDNIFTIKDNTNLKGYFQCEKYFNFCRDIILNNLEFKQETCKESDKLFDSLDINPNETTSIHVRRGDYLKKTKYHPVQPTSYFTEAIKKCDTNNYLFFSDDIDWCKRVFGKNKRVFFSENNSPFVDLLSMSKCKNNIIVNSSFSWWGGWLNKNPDKIVVAPTNWFGPSGIKRGYNDRDIIPETWIKI